MSWSYKIENRDRTISSFFLDLFKYKLAFIEIIKKDVKTTYAQSILGPFYFIILPFAQALIFNFLLTNIAKVNFSGDVPNYLFYLSGFIFWNYFSISASRSSAGIVNNIKLIQQIALPSSVFLISPIIFTIISFLISLILFFLFNILFMLITDYTFKINLNYLLIFPLLFYCIILALTYGLIISALSIKFRDIIYGNALIFQILMIGSCVLYPAKELLNLNLNWVLYVNPFIIVSETFRWICFQSQFNLLSSHIYSQIIILILFFALGLGLFLRNEKRMVDMI